MEFSWEEMRWEPEEGLFSERELSVAVVARERE